MKKRIINGTFDMRLNSRKNCYYCWYGTTCIGYYENGKFCFFRSMELKYFTIAEIDQLSAICGQCLIELSQIQF